MYRYQTMKGNPCHCVYFWVVDYGRQSEVSGMIDELHDVTRLVLASELTHAPDDFLGVERRLRHETLTSEQVVVVLRGGCGRSRAERGERDAYMYVHVNMTS